jgi:hypothetical protein
MKNVLMFLHEKLLLRKRSLVETVFDYLKNKFMLEHSRHRSFLNMLVHIISTLIAYQLKTSKHSASMKYYIHPNPLFAFFMANLQKIHPDFSLFFSYFNSSNLEFTFLAGLLFDGVCNSFQSFNATFSSELSVAAGGVLRLALIDLFQFYNLLVFSHIFRVNIMGTN